MDPSPSVADFSAFDLRVGEILSVEKHPQSDNIYVEKI